MIFSVEGHIDQIIRGEKTQTRRASDRYQVGRLYSIQPGRTKPGTPDGKILIIGKRVEERPKRVGRYWWVILPEDAEAEGGYEPQEYEELYERLHPGWTRRWAHLFRYYPTEAVELMERGEFPGFMLDQPDEEGP